MRCHLTVKLTEGVILLTELNLGCKIKQPQIVGLYFAIYPYMYQKQC